MKKAVGELSSAVIVVISVAILIAFFYYTVWPIIENNFHAETSCDKAICDPTTKGMDGHTGKVKCKMPGTSGEEDFFWCNYKG